MTSSADASTDRWVELSLAVGVEAVEAVSEILGRESAGTSVQPARLVRDPDDELEARPDPDAEQVVTAHIPDDDRASATVDRVERALWHLQAFGLGPVGPLRTRRVTASDWTDTWRAHYVPQRVGRVVIVPSWVEEPVADDEVRITLDPGMAFGTGLHPTTRNCLTLLQEVAPMPRALLDVGCGSGILALAGLRLGVDRAVACDTDPVAVRATIDNAARNDLAGRVTAWAGSLPAMAAERYPLVVANLVAAVLVDLAPRLAAHVAADGVLLASGIIAPRASEVVKAMEGAGLAVTARRDDGEWVSLRLEPTV